MNYPLKRLYETKNLVFGGLGFVLRPDEGIITYQNTVYRINDTMTDTVLNRIVNGWVEDVKKKRKAAQQARQTRLLPD
jgi:hypothetical protein